MKDGTQLPLRAPDLVIKGDIHTQELNRDQTLLRVEVSELLFLELQGMAAGITLPAGTDVLIIVPESYGRWIDDRYFEQAERDHKARMAEQLAAVAGGAVSLAEGEVDVSYHNNGEADKIPF